jgi:hypothetical protein
VLVGALVFGTVLASASTLGVNAGVIQVGTDMAVACDTNGVDVVWNANYQGRVTSVNLSGISTDCVGQNLYFYALDNQGKIVGAPHDRGLGACGAPGDPLSVNPTTITGVTMKVDLGWVNPRDEGLGSATYPCGVLGSDIEGARIVIGV